MGTRVYVGRLSYRATESDLENFFRDYGRIREVVRKNGFGFVEFEDPRDADDAVYELNGKHLCGERVVLEFSHRGPPRGLMDRGGHDRFFPPRRESRYGPPQQTRHRLIVENLSSRCSWQDLKDLMRTVGEVTFADAHKERPNEGVVCFQTREDLERALEKLQGKDVNGRKIKLVDDSENRERSTPRKRSRSRSTNSRTSGSRSRSGSETPKKSKSKSGSPAAKRSRSGTPNSRSRSRSQDLPKAGTEGPQSGGDAVQVEPEVVEERTPTPKPDLP